MDKQCQDRMKKYFKQIRDGSVTVVRERPKFVYSSEFSHSLSSGSDVSTRLAALSMLAERSRLSDMEDQQISQLLRDVHDVFQPPLAFTPVSTVADLALLDRQTDLPLSDAKNSSTQSRPAATTTLHDFATACLCTIVEQQRHHMSISRSRVLNLASSGLEPPISPSATISRLLPNKVELLSTLTDNGRDLYGVESAIFCQLTILLMHVHADDVSTDCQRVTYRLLTNCVKFNAAFLTLPAAERLVRFLYVQARHTELTVECCLSTLDTLICYGDIPGCVVSILARWLARLVCAPRYTRFVWRIMRHLLGTSHGATALNSLVTVLETRSGDSALMKGAVFGCAAALWSGNDSSGALYINSPANQLSDQRVASLHVLAGSVLPAFQSALLTQRPAVVYEVTLELSRLVNGAQSFELLPHNWYCLLHMCDMVHSMIVGDGCFTSLDRCNSSSSDGELLTSAVLLRLQRRLESLLVAILTRTVRLRYGSDGGDVLCCIDEYQLDSVLDKCSHLLPTDIVVGLVTRLARNASLTAGINEVSDISTNTAFGNGVDSMVGGANLPMGGVSQPVSGAESSASTSHGDGQQSAWLLSLHSLVERYFVHEHRVGVRLAVCGIAEQIWRGYRSLQPKAVWRNVVRPMAVAVGCVSIARQSGDVSSDATTAQSSIDADNSEQSQLRSYLLQLLILVASTCFEHVPGDGVTSAVATVGDVSAIASECVELIHSAIARVVSLAEQQLPLPNLAIEEAATAATATLQLFERQLVEEQLENGGVTAQLLVFLLEQLDRVYRLSAEWKVLLRKLHEVWLYWFLRLCCDCHGRVGLLQVNGGRDRSDATRSEASSGTANSGAEEDRISTLDFSSINASSVVFSRCLLFESGGAEECNADPLRVRIPSSSYHRLWSSLLLTERDFLLLSATLTALPVALRSPRLLLATSSSGGPVDYLAATLYQLSARLDANFCSRLLRLPLNQQLTSESPGVSTSVAASACRLMRAQLVTVLASLTAYHHHLSAPQQRRLVACLETGLRTRSAPQCVHALSVCALSVRESMYRVIGDVLTSLSKLSATVSLAISVTELLSTLMCAPALCNSFSTQQYRCVFAIALPYTNPLKFSHYVVSLAHHVLVVWFVKCKPSCRLALVRYIVAGLRSNMMDLRPLVARHGTSGQAVVANEDSSGRRRSSSLSDHGAAAATGVASSRGGSGGETTDRALHHAQDTSTTNTRGSSTTTTATDTRHHSAEARASWGAAPLCVSADTLMFAQQLAETCVDLMARYIGPNLAVVHHNSAFMQRRLNNAVTRTWIIDNRYITVRVAGCGSPVAAGSNSLCQHCLAHCQSVASQCASARASSTVLSRFPTGRSATISTTAATTRFSMPLEEGATVGLRASESEGGAYKGARRRHTSVPQGCLITTPPPPPTPTLSVAAAKNVSTTSSTEGATVKDASVDVQCDSESAICRCWCQGWGELVVRRPSGNMAWLIRLRNRRVRLSVPPANSQPATMDSSLGSGRGCVSCCSASSDVSNQLSSDATRGQCLDNCDARREQQSGNSACLALVTSFGGGNGSDVISSSPAAAATATVVDVADDTPPELLPQQIFLQLFHSPLVNMNDLLSASALEVSECESSTSTAGSPAQAVCPAATSSVVAMLPADETTDRSLQLFDHIPAREVHKVGVLYMGAGQINDEVAILRNRAGSHRYDKFVQGLGRLVNIRHCDASCVYLGGLSQDGRDGNYTIVWEDHLLQMMFHVATMIPVLDSDDRCNNKKLHVGNVFVLIVYNESGRTLQSSPISGQFGYACVVVEPQCHGLNLISVVTKPILKELFGERAATLVSDQCVSLIARQMALHADLASLIHRHGQNHPEPYASNWLERLRFIRRHRAKLLAGNQAPSISAASRSQTSASSSGGGSGLSHPQQQQQQRSPVCLDFTKLFD